MAQTLEGAMKILAEKVGISLADYKKKRSAGQKWCFKCRSWKPFVEFGFDRTRYDGLAVYCLIHRRVTKRKPWRVHPNPMTGRPGPVPMSPRDGDKVQARQRINVEVRTGRRPHPNLLPCTDCGHRWKPGERRHHYDHHKGYGTKDHYDVESVCTLCHANRDSARKKQIHCLRGHAFTPENTIMSANGTRKCRECRRAYDQNRRDAAYWRAYRTRRGRNSNG